MGDILVSTILPLALAFIMFSLGLGLTPADFAFGVMILALCPGGVTSNLLTRLAGGDVALSVTLTAVASLLAVLTVPPLAAFFAGRILGEAAASVNVAALALAL